MGIRVTGFEELLRGLDADLALMRRSTQHGRLQQRLRGDFSEISQDIWKTGGAAIDGGWGTYAHTYAPNKQAGDSYIFVETGELSRSLIGLNFIASEYTHSAILFGSDVEYAERVHEQYGAIVGYNADFERAVEGSWEDWFVAESRLPWARV